MTFDQAFDKVIQDEGGYSYHPLDNGGATNYGITLSVARENCYEGDMRDLPIDVAKAIDRKCYWEAVKADSLPHDCVFTYLMLPSTRACRRPCGGCSGLSTWAPMAW
jgi:lysozyme family protein